MSRTRIVLAAALAAVLLAPLGLTPAATAQAPEPIKIGAILAVTGPAANLGKPEANTLEMLIEQTNATGGIKGRPVQLIVKDSQGNPEKAISFAKQLIEEDQVFAIIGPSTTGETMKIKDLCEQAGTLLISCAAAEVIVNPVARFVFKTPQMDSQAVQRIYGTLKELGITQIGVVASTTGFGNAGKAQLEKLAPSMGITILISETYDKDATDLSAVLTKLKAAGVKAVVNWSIEPAQSIVPKNMKQIGLDVPLFQSHGFGNIRYVQAAGEAAEGIIFPAGRLLIAESLPADHPQRAVLVKYKTDYETRFKEDASTFGGHAYDAFLVLTAGINAAPEISREAVRTAIEGQKGLAGTAGVFNFSATDHCGLDLGAFEMLTVKGGKFVPYHHHK
ncbi:MAG: ABC transporter substrate-binding protein [Candidatus Latescibacterota bacterium]|jgi:branched-chain amino acid transport system substrate-binding protein